MSDNTFQRKYPNPPEGTHTAEIKWIEVTTSKKGFKQLKISYAIGNARISDWVTIDPNAFLKSVKAWYFYKKKYDQFVGEFGGQLPEDIESLRGKTLTLTVKATDNEAFPVSVYCYGYISDESKPVTYKQPQPKHIDESEDVPF
jgi:hypothetical protein